MDCTDVNGENSFGCMLNDMGGWLGNGFLNPLGNPLGTVFLLISVVALVGLVLYAGKQAIQ